MDEHVSKPSHSLPGHIRVRFAEFRRELFHGFPDHLKIPDDGVLQDVRGFERVTSVLGRLLNPANAFRDVLYINGISR